MIFRLYIRKVIASACALAMASLTGGYYLLLHFYTEGGPLPVLFWVGGVLAFPGWWVVRILDELRLHQPVLVYALVAFVQFAFYFTLLLLVLWVWHCLRERKA